MINKNYDKKAMSFEELDGEKIKIEWELKDKNLIRTSFFPKNNAKIKRIFNFVSRTASREVINTKTNETLVKAGYKKTFKEVNKDAPSLFKKAVKQYIKFIK